MITALREDRSVRIPADAVSLPGRLHVPIHPVGLVLFSHGGGSGRNSPRNNFVATTFNRFGLATLLLDLLTAEEAEVANVTQAMRFDIPLLATRLIAATDWCARQPDLRELSLGYFGASNGAAAALIATTLRPDRVDAIVTRGGRTDLAGDALLWVRAPTLLIAGAADDAVLALNREAIATLRSVKHLAVVPSATHLFEEPGTLEQVATLARKWFVRYLACRPAMLS